MTTSRDASAPTRFVRGSGNVFGDLGLPDSEEALAKARLAEKTAETIKRRLLTRSQAAAILGVDGPTLSLILSARLDGFTSDGLLRLVMAIGGADLL